MTTETLYAASEYRVTHVGRDPKTGAEYATVTGPAGSKTLWVSVIEEAARQDDWPEGRAVYADILRAVREWRPAPKPPVPKAEPVAAELPNGREVRLTATGRYAAQPPNDNYWREFRTLARAIRFGTTGR